MSSKFSNAFFIIALLLFTGCADYSSIPGNELCKELENETFEPSGFRSISEAEWIAIAEADRIFDSENASSRSSGKRTVNSRLTKTIYSSIGSRGSADPLMHVVNFDDEAGFVIVPANSSAPRSIVVAEAGSYDPDSSEENPGFDVYMDRAKDFLTTLSLNDFVIRPPYQPGGEKTVVDTVVSGWVTPRVPVKWWQNGIFGRECENGIAGCTHTALGMMLTYFETPSSITLTYNNGISNYKSKNKVIQLDWDVIGLHNIPYRRKPIVCVCEEDSVISHLTIAQLLRQLGEFTCAEYSESATKTYSDNYDMIEILSMLGLKTTYWAYPISKNAVCEVLDKSSILYMRGYDFNSGVGHSWLCDGWKRYSITAYRYITNDGGITWVPDGGGPTWQKDEVYNHYCWGYNDGKKDGYYLDMDFYLGKYHDEESNTDIPVDLSGFVEFYKVVKQ